MSYTYEFPHPAVTADICIFSIRDGRLNVLLIQRLIEPFKDSWAIPGGFIKMDEDLIEGAARELEEETGYAAAEWIDLGEFLSSPGMTDESFTLLRARGLTKVGEGGGLETEDIVVHRVALADLPSTVAAFREGGGMIDAKLLAVLGHWIHAG